MMMLCSKFHGSTVKIEGGDRFLSHFQNTEIIQGVPETCTFSLLLQAVEKTRFFNLSKRV